MSNNVISFITERESNQNDGGPHVVIPSVSASASGDSPNPGGAIALKQPVRREQSMARVR